MFRSYLKKLKSNRSKTDAVAKYYISQHVSAAGVSYTVTEHTRLRRHLWMIGVAGCIILMMYMTINVIAEYLGYPKMLLKEDMIMSRLPFPAVTVCSLNPVLEKFANETSLRRHLELRKLLKAAHPLEPRSEMKSDCAREPLCKWSWFLESCQCVNNPCRTEFCLPYDDSHCLCSSDICRDEKLSCSRVPGKPMSWTQNVCMCDSTKIHEPAVKGVTEANLNDILSKVDNVEVKEIIQLIWNSNTFDLTDIEEGLMPTMDDIYEYGITFDSLVASCSFELNQCHRDNFTVLYHPKYGKCYMFNYIGGTSKVERKPIDTNKYGSNSGLRLLLRVTDQESMELIRREVGARIVIHDPYLLPFVVESGINLRPMDMTAIDVTMSTMTRLASPWGTCVKGGKIEDEPYSILGCATACDHNYMTEQCQCAVRDLLRGSVYSKPTTSYHLCNLTDPEERECVERVLGELEKSTVNCNCKPPCNETIYSYSVTSSELNSNFYKTVKAIRTLTLAHDDDGERLTYVNAMDQKSMIGVKVYYSTFQVSEQSEVASYSWETLIANVGGNLGFFMGLTLVTFLELAEFLWDILRTSCGPPEGNKKGVLPKPPQKTDDHLTEKKLHLKSRSKSLPDGINIFICDSYT